MLAVVSLSFCLSLMFPTIYGVALKGLGPATKFGAAGLVMAIVGGAIMPLVQGKLVDATSPAFSFIVPAFCFAVVGLYALYDLKAEPSVTGGQPVRDVGRATPPARRNPPRARGERTLAGQRSSRPPWPPWPPWSVRAGNAPTSATMSTNQLEVVSWWTSKSESAALNDLFAAFRKSNPGVRAINGAVAGGAGSNAIVELAKRLQRNDPPDVWQTFAGKSVQGYASRGVIRSVASIFARERLSATMNPTILKALMRDGRPYGVPTGAHRSNVLWFNTKLLQRARVAPPSSGYTVDSFISDLGKIKASGATPLCLGAKDRFTTVELFENTLLSSIGTRGWQHMVQNGLDWRSKQVQTALKNFGAILRYADPEASRLTWDQATKKLAAAGARSSR